MKFDVFLNSGVMVTVPDGTNPDTNEGYELIKKEAKHKLLDLLNYNAFDVEIEEYND